MDVEYIESVSASLVREYLSRKGMKMTLQVMDDECPRVKGSLNNRMELAKTLHIEKLIKRNKETPQPLRTFIEIITGSYLEKAQGKDGLEQGSIERPSTSSARRRGRGGGGGGPGRGVDGDLVIEDNIEGETIVGEGKAGLLGREEEQEDIMDVGGRQRKAGTPRRGMGAPVTSNVDEWERRMNRPKSSRLQPRGASPSPAPSSTSSTSGFKFESHGVVRSGLKDNSNTASKSKLSEPGSLTATNRPTLDSNLSIRGSSLFENGAKPEEPKRIVKSALRPPKPNDGLDFETALSRLAKNAHTGRRSSSKEDDFDDCAYNVDKSSIANTDVRSRPSSSKTDARSSPPKRPGTASTRVGDVEMGDIEDDLDAEVGDLDLAPRMPTQQPTFNVESKPIDARIASELKTLIFGSANQNFNDEWKLQSFTFCDLPKLQYGIVQKKGGSCGVLASVQATVLQELIFCDATKKSSLKSLEPSRITRSQALARALARILWRVGEEKQAIVTLPSSRVQFQPSSRCKGDGLTETLLLYTLNSLADLQAFMQQNVNQFELDGQSGVVLSLYSVILSRNVANVKKDMDQETNTLMGAHGYCTQEMVNLYLSGRAASNVFNDVMELDSGEGPVTILKGVHQRCDIGMLSLFEHYKSCQVGTYMKTPKYPIWVICSESHFSVLFCLKKQLMSDWKAEKRFDLYYYDELGRQDAEIKLTIDTTNRFFKAPSEEELVSPIEHCIRTKWSDAEIDWNGTEPLL